MILFQKIYIYIFLDVMKYKVLLDYYKIYQIYKGLTLRILCYYYKNVLKMMIK